MLLDVPRNQINDGGRVLVNDQATSDLGMRFCWQNRFDAFSLEPSPDTIDLQRGTCREMLLGSIARFSLQGGHTNLLLILLRVEGNSGDGNTICLGEWPYGIVKGFNPDLAVRTAQGGQDGGQGVNGIGHRATI